LGYIMAAEIICVGTELLLGDILNSNLQYLGQGLAALGIPHFYQTVVGDNIDRIHQVLEVATKRSNILIFTGGLGPTADDLTTEAIASYFDTPLKRDEAVVADIEQKFASRDREMAPSNLKQALRPVGADILPNPKGTAPGMIWQPTEHLTILTFPGVPRELYAMWEETAIPFFKDQGWGQDLIHSEMLRFRGVTESGLAEQVAHLLSLANPTVAPYASQGEIRLRVSAKAPSVEAAMALIEPVATEIRSIAGNDYFGSDGDTLTKVVGNLLKLKSQTLSVAESCTGGGLGSMITEVSGSSSYFLGGVQSYGNGVKIKVLGVPSELIETKGAVSAEVAKAMAIGVQELMGSDWALSITGIAGPGGGTVEKPVGLVYIGIAHPNGTVEALEYKMGTTRDRDLIRHLSSCTALDQLRRRLLVNQEISG
jgi:nicotinamide-nucleotide amidase